MNELLAALQSAGIPNAARELSILQKHFEGDALKSAVKRRAARIPMAQILGYRDFWRDRFEVNSNVLDPRPDSELFLDLALAQNRQFARILDLGTGTGALGLSALREFEAANAVLVDQSLEALETAKRNAANLNLAARAQFVPSDWFENVEGQFDLILCNPPYLTKDELQNAQIELEFEPASALSDFGDGLAHYRQIAAKLHKYLTQDGIAFFEHGHQQSAPVADIFKKAGFKVENHRDLSGNPRIVAVFLPNYEKIGAK